ncbi:MAG: alanyl-tRNA editing protein [Myxococcota bacterium]
MSLLRCQTDAYLRELTTVVQNILPVNDAGLVDVVLAETVLYPEGGGQPSDFGQIDGQPVLSLRRGSNGLVYHRLAQPPAQETVTITVDWPRRFDHMQQHTAQHLISALAADRFGAETTAFHLRPDICDIDLSGVLSTEAVTDLQEQVNAVIRADHPVRHRLVAAAALDTVRTRGLPEGFAGPVRLVEIEGVDLNTCGGTHVASTAALHAVVLLPLQKNKLRYLAGQRVIDAVQTAAARDLALSQLLSCGVAEHLDAVARLQQGARRDRSAVKDAHQELAQLLGASLARTDAPVAVLHRPEADMNLLRTIASAAMAERDDSVYLLLGDGVFMLAGPDAAVAAAGPQIAAALGGRGGGRGGRFQGRFSRVDGLDDAVSLLHPT